MFIPTTHHLRLFLLLIPSLKTIGHTIHSVVDGAVVGTTVAAEAAAVDLIPTVTIPSHSNNRLRWGGGFGWYPLASTANSQSQQGLLLAPFSHAPLQQGGLCNTLVPAQKQQQSFLLVRLLLLVHFSKH